MEKPFSPACERNRDPILKVLKAAFEGLENVLEIGSGTGQHAAYFSKQLPHIVWQPSDRKQNMEGISMWTDEASHANLMKPFELDVTQIPDGLGKYDAVFAANIFHIMSTEQVECFFRLVEKCVIPEGKLCVYGPFNYNGEFTSVSNREFDCMLRSRNEKMGIRDFDWINSLAGYAGFKLEFDHEMPANNRLLEWYKTNK